MMRDAIAALVACYTRPHTERLPGRRPRAADVAMLLAGAASAVGLGALLGVALC
jgi:hypothetical protein